MPHQESLFCTSLVPLQLDINNKCLWRNPIPSSPIFCRPIRLQYQKETPELIKTEHKYITDQISDITTDIINVQVNDSLSVDIEMEYNLRLTMVDGKAINALLGVSSTQSCNLCGAKPTELNCLEKLQNRTIKREGIEFGFSLLHCWIRCFEYILHIGYKMEIQKWQARSKEEKDSLSTRKKYIQTQFSEKLSLTVDQPKVGHGSTNDGNTARRAFQNSKVFSEITGVKEEIIVRFHNILQVISCKQELNIEQFDFYCTRTAETLIEVYPWYRMPSSVHKLLLHAPLIVKDFLLPVGLYSEEAQEALNKHVRSARADHSRKISRRNTMIDQLHYLLIYSDPVISSIGSMESKTSI